MAFKMESHNHPSFIEPYQGAATGVGGILRDIFTMGARPSLWLIIFVSVIQRRSYAAPWWMELCAGFQAMATVLAYRRSPGQTEFHSSYDKNILVNAFALGLFEEGDPVVTQRRSRRRQLVVYVGAKTGRDGVHGASMASESFGKDSAAKRPTVQIGDPFFEKLPIESCLEVMKKTSWSRFKTWVPPASRVPASKWPRKEESGLRMDLDQVPLRDPTMGPEEILLSESQERMLLICEPVKFKDLEKVFTRWGLDAKKVGEVTKGPNVELYWHGEKIVSIPPQLLTVEAPMFERPYSPWKNNNHVESVAMPEALSFQPELKRIMSSPQGGSREWIYHQYDQRVGGRTLRDASDTVAAIRLKSDRALSINLGCRPQLCERMQGSELSIPFFSRLWKCQ